MNSYVSDSLYKQSSLVINYEFVKSEDDTAEVWSSKEEDFSKVVLNINKTTAIKPMLFP